MPVVNDYTIEPGAYLVSAQLRGADLQGVDLSNANLSSANLRGANLRGANLRSAQLYSAELEGADLTGADLTNARLRRADLTRANFTNACLEDADLNRTTRYRWITTDATLPDDMPCDECNLTDCECTHCSNCGERTDSICDRCDNGTDCCCSHAYCESCERRVDSDDYCGDCSTCTRCCDCSSGASFEGDTNPSRTWPAKRGECARMAGVEYETTEMPESECYDWADKWGAGWHQDGSCGYEAVTAPAAGGAIDAQLTELGDVIGKTNDSCGIHVHVDARDYTWADMYRLLRVYSKIEPLLYLLGGQKRLTNTYCAPCGEEYADALQADDRKNAVLAVAYGTSPAGKVEVAERRGKARVMLAGKYQNRFGRTKKFTGRYRGLNIAPWVFGRKVSRGRAKRPDTTVEFRLHRNGKDVKRVIGWTHLCVAIVEWCHNASEAEASKLPKSALRALLQIAPKSREYILGRIREWRKSTMVGSGQSRRIDARTWTIKSNPEERVTATRRAEIAAERAAAEQRRAEYEARIRAANEARREASPQQRSYLIADIELRIDGRRVPPELAPLPSTQDGPSYREYLAGSEGRFNPQEDGGSTITFSDGRTVACDCASCRQSRERRMAAAGGQ